MLNISLLWETSSPLEPNNTPGINDNYTIDDEVHFDSEEYSLGSKVQHYSLHTKKQTLREISYYGNAAFL